jgi:MYXO-CTERM domain-containing protein
MTVWIRFRLLAIGLLGFGLLVGCSEPGAPETSGVGRVLSKLSIGDEHQLEVPESGAQFSAKPADDAQNASDVAAGKVNDEPGHLAVWRHQRPDLGRWDVHGTRLSSDGTVLDTGGIAIGLDAPAGAPRSAYNPAAEAFLTVWVSSGNSVRFSRIAPDGTQLDPVAGQQVGVPQGTTRVDVASNGGMWLIVYSGLPPNAPAGNIMAQRVDADGMLVGPAWVVAQAGVGVAVAWHESSKSFLVVYRRTNQIILRAVHETNGPSGVEKVLGSGDSFGGASSQFDVASMATHAIVTWTRLADEAACLYDVVGRIVDQDLYAFGEFPVSPCAAYDYLIDDAPRASVYGIEFFVSYRRTAWGFDVVPETPLGLHGWRFVYPNIDRFIIDETASGVAAMAGSAGRHVVVWPQSNADGAPTTIVHRVVQAGAVQGVERSYTSTRRSHRRQVAIAGRDEHLVLWQDDTAPDGHDNVVALRLAQDGEPQASVFPIAAGIAQQTDPAVAAGKNGWLAVWLDRDTPAETPQVSVRRVASDGSLADRVHLGNVAVGDGANDHGPPSVVFDGEQFSIVFARGAVGAREIVLRRVHADGTVDAAFEAIVAEKLVGQDNADPAVAFIDGKAWVVWSRVGTGGWDIFGALVDSTGTPSPAIPLCTADGDQLAPRLASATDRSLVIWQDHRTGGQRIHGAVLMANGEPLAGAEDIPVVTSRAHDYDVSMADDGHNFLVAWEGTPTNGTSDIFARWVSLHGAVQEVSPTPVATHATAERGPALAMGRGGKVLLAYARRRGPPYTSWRVMTRIIDSGSEDGASCADSADCASRVCIDGVCCDRACSGSCESCALVAGVCSAVKGATDDTCFGDKICDADGACKDAAGQSCDQDASCASGYCAAGVCCDQRCGGPCQTCASPRGSCITRDCGFYSCDENRQCRTRCDSSGGCAEGYQCFADGHCLFPVSEPEVRGCACSVRGADDGSHAWLAFVGFLLLASWRRRSGARLVLVLIGGFSLGCQGRPAEATLGQAAANLVTAATTLGGEIEYVNAAPGLHRGVTLAASGTGFYATWRYALPGGKWRLLGTPIDREDGMPGAPATRLVDGVTARRSGLAHAGGSYLVAWHDVTGQLSARRIDAQSHALVGDVISLGASSDDTNVTVASDGQRWLVAWGRTFGGQAQVHASLIETNGAVTSLAALDGAVFSSKTTRRLIHAAALGTGWIVTWVEDDGVIKAHAYGAMGNALGTAAPLTKTENDKTIAAKDNAFSLAAKSQTALAVWLAPAPKLNTRPTAYLRKMHVDGAGNLVLDDVSYTSQYGLPGARDVHASPQQDGWMISLSALSIPSLSGKRYLRTYRWGDSSTLHPLINFALGSNFDDRQMPAAVSAEGRTLFAWEQGLVAGDIKTSFWKGELEILPNVNAPPNGILSLQQPLARSANRQIDVDLAANIGSDKHLLVYSDARGYKAAIRGAHLNSSGVVIGEVFDISDYKFGAGDPRVARLDGGWLAAWRSNPKQIGRAHV